MRDQQIQAEWTCAVDSLRAAEVLHTQRLSRDAVSRAYYSVMHAARAILLIHDVKATTHSAVRRQFGETLVKTGEVEKEWARILASAQDKRAAADYDVDKDVSGEMSEDLLRLARRFLERLAEHAVSKGVTLLCPWR